MTGTTPAAFDPKPRQLGVVTDVYATSAILAGQLVGYNGTGVNWYVEPTDDVTTTGVVGVALYSQASADGHVAVAGPGSIVKLCEGDGAAIDAGDSVMLSASTALGCISTYADTADHFAIGVAMENIDANGKGYVLLTAPVWIGKGA